MTVTEYKIHNTYIYKKMIRNLAPYALEVKSELIRQTMCFGKYMLKPPREFLGTNSENVLNYIPQTAQH